MKRKILLVCMLCGALSMTAQTYKNGVWYSLYDETEHTMNTQGDYETGDVFAPTAGKLNVRWRYEWIDLLGAFKKIDTKVLESANGGSNTNSVGSLAENTDKNSNTTEQFTVSQNINWIKYNRAGYPTHKVIVYHQDIELAKHILLASGAYGATTESHSFDDIEVSGTSEAYTVSLRSFLTAGDIAITSSLPEIFRVGTADNTSGLTYAVGNNACASQNGTANEAAEGTLGNIANYDFAIYFTPQEACLYEATITITDGTSTATVKVSGTGLKLSQAITWEPESPILSSGSIDPAKSSSGLEVSYSFAPEGVVSYAEGAFTILQAGEVTITASQEGDAQYEAAEPVKRTLLIYPAVTHYAYKDTICEGDVYSDEHFKDLTIANTYFDTLKTVHGGDSIIMFTLYVNPVYRIEEQLAIRQGESFVWNQIDLSAFAPGDTTLEAAYTSVTGCDSTHVLVLHIKPSITTYGNDTVSLCKGESYVFEGKTYRSSTVDSVLLSTPNIYGGDSIVVLVVNVYRTVNITMNDTITEGVKRTWQDIDLSVLPVGDTTLVASYLTSHGCDSTYVLHLTVEQRTQGLIHTDTETVVGVQRIIQNGQVFIRKGDAWYDLLGRKRL
jgi:hypothetical protein